MADLQDGTKTKIIVETEDSNKEINNINNDGGDLVDDIETTIAKLDKAKDAVVDDRYSYLYQGFWIPEPNIRGVISFQRSYVARDDDIVLASCPKSGTTWLKALSFSIVNRTKFSPSENPLLFSIPHQLVPFIERNADTKTEPSDLENDASPRLYATHIPLSSLPPSIMSSKAKILYVSRNPLDLFVSLWHFAPKLWRENVEPCRLGESFDSFCRGIHAYGPFWDHNLEFWKASLDHPEKILFLRYEDLKKDGSFWVKKIANFLGYPFSKEEEDLGVVEEILKLCSIENMKSLDVNKNGKHPVLGFSHSIFFRKGEVGNWVNYLTPEMAEKAKNIMAEKFGGSGLTFEF